MDNLINKMFPPKCLFCNTVGDIFCDNCISNCNILPTQFCVVCDRQSEDGFTHKSCIKTGGEPLCSVSVYEYEGLVRECIRKSKYSQREFMALKKLSFEAVSVAYDWGLDFADFRLVPIPVSKGREKQRGFNQVDVISKAVSMKFKVPIDISILSRIRDTKAQHGVGREQRFLNVKGAFEANKNVSGYKILLVDDICTTGATFLEASKVLYKSGALEVWCFSLSKKIRELV